MTRFDSALDVAAAIRARDVSPTEVLEHYLDQADTLDPTLNVFSLRDDERARADAAAATELVASSAPDELPAFCGVPLPIKDLTRSRDGRPPTDHVGCPSSPRRPTIPSSPGSAPRGSC